MVKDKSTKQAASTRWLDATPVSQMTSPQPEVPQNNNIEDRIPNCCADVILERKFMKSVTHSDHSMY